MTASARPLPANATAPGRPFIAADVGGTHVRIGLVRASGDPAQPIAVLQYRKYACADWPGLAEIVGDFLSGLDGMPVDEGAIASAGYALADGTVITANLPWRISLNAIRAQLGFREFRLVNDFEAVAHAATHVDAGQALLLTGPDGTAAGPTLVIGPGTGLGAAVRIPTPKGTVVLATEAGHAALTASDELEMDLLRILRRGRGHVANESALSGPGLMQLHEALRELRGGGPAYATPDAITAAALGDSDPLARETLEVFCGLLGATVGDMALLYGARGGIYLAGGILPQIRGFLLRSRFVERFLDKGPMRAALERIPVRLIEHGQLGVIGAASWYLDRRGTDWK